MRIEDQFTKLKISRQRKYQMRRMADGKCRQCGDPAAAKGAVFCNPCGLASQRRSRKTQNNNPRYKSGRGRKPIYKANRKKTNQ